MAYPNQDFGEAAPPDAGGHIGAFTRPDHLFDANRKDRPEVVRPISTRAPRPPIETGVWRVAAAVVLAIAAGIALLAT
jgi:hypothetical protein